MTDIARKRTYTEVTKNRHEASFKPTNQKVQKPKKQQKTE